MLAVLRRLVVSRLRIFTRREQALRAVTWVALRVLPARRVAVVHGWPDSEGNAVEVLRGLLRRYPGTVYWVRNRGTMRSQVALPDVPPGKLVEVEVNTLRAFLAQWRAEVVFFTHGLMSAVTPPRSRLVVNLWHGDGPKLVTDPPRAASTVVVASTTLWGREKGRMFGLGPDEIAVVGNPRVDSMLDRAPMETRQLLGLPDDGMCTVLWMPTFRRGWDGGRATWDEGSPLSRAVRGGIPVPDGVRLLVKPHPFDTDDYSGLGATVLTNADLDTAGVTLLQLMTVADAMISDASSAWVDYLALDRPVGFFLPDLDEYGTSRGYNVPDLVSVLPGPVLRDRDDVGRFLTHVRNGDAVVPSDHEALERLGFRTELPVTDRLFDWLDTYQLRRGAPAIFGASKAKPARDIAVLVVERRLYEDGGTRVVLRLVELWRAARVRARVYVLQHPRAGQAGPHVPAGVEPIYPVRSRTMRQRWVLLIGLLRLLPLARGADVVLAGREIDLGLVWGRIAALVVRRPFAVLVQSAPQAALDQYVSRRLHPVMRWALRTAHRVVCVSPGLVPAVEALGVDSRRVAVVLNGLDLDEVAQRASAPVAWLPEGDGPLVVGLGRLVHQKGFDVLLRAHARVLADGVPHRLLIVGEGTERQSLERLADELGVAGTVHLPGFVGNPLPILGAADLFCLPSRWEGFGLSLAEALLTSTPVIAADCVSGPRFLLSSGEFGDLVPVEDVDALAAAIRRHLGEPARLQAAAEAGRAWATDHLDFRRTAEQTLEVLRQVAAERRPPA